MAEININKVFKEIKKQNGEKFARVLRDNVLLDIPDLKHILEFAGDNQKDAENLVPILREIRDDFKNTQVTKQVLNENPIELLKKAGYDAFVVKNEKEKDSIKKYFRPGEELCTFWDTTRHINNYIIHAIKHNAEDIKPAIVPERQDEYGVSVISIQIAKSGGFISIKNRYNHTVNNPDATFNNNPDNIIPGLTEALKKEFGVDFEAHQAIIPHNYRMVNNQLVRFNYELNNTYYDEKYYLEGTNIIKLNTDYELMVDYVILNTKTKTLRTVSVNDSIFGVLSNEITDKKIEIRKDKEYNVNIVNIIDENKNSRELLRTKNGHLTSLNLYKTTEIKNYFMNRNNFLENIYAPELKIIKSGCFCNSSSLKTLNMPKLEKIEDNCFVNAESLKELYLPELKVMMDWCFYNVNSLKILDLSKVKEMGGHCFSVVNSLNQLNLPNLDNVPKHIKKHMFKNTKTAILETQNNRLNILSR